MSLKKDKSSAKEIIRRPASAIKFLGFLILISATQALYYNGKKLS
jgi:hypothetical protein